MRAMPWPCNMQHAQAPKKSQVPEVQRPQSQQMSLLKVQRAPPTLQEAPPRLAPAQGLCTSCLRAFAHARALLSSRHD